MQNFDGLLPNNGSIHGGERIEKNQQLSVTISDNEEQPVLLKKLSVSVVVKVRKRNQNIIPLSPLLDIVANR
jgi:flagellar biosynthesis/type III secretory pathway M-ring protein FliF/YscJ